MLKEQSALGDHDDQKENLYSIIDKQMKQITMINELYTKLQVQYHNFKSEASSKLISLEKQVDATKQKAELLQQKVNEFKNIEDYLNDTKIANELINNIRDIIINFDNCKIQSIENKTQATKNITEKELIQNKISFPNEDNIDFDNLSMKKRNQRKKLFA